MYVQKRRDVNNMNSKEFKKALDLLVKEKDISEDYIIESMTLALTSAYKKNYKSLANVKKIYLCTNNFYTLFGTVSKYLLRYFL